MYSELVKESLNRTKQESVVTCNRKVHLGVNTIYCSFKLFNILVSAPNVVLVMENLMGRERNCIQIISRKI